MTHLLIVEDESKVMQFLQSALSSEGYWVTGASDYQEAEDAIQSGVVQPEIIVMDRMLRGKDGTRLIPLFRRTFPQSRILVLSAINTHEEKAAALDLGADDYLAKPFSLVELSARIRALVRRGGSDQPSSLLQCRDLTLDLLRRTASVSGRKLELSNKEFQLLSVLVRTPTRVFSRLQLLDQVWRIHSEIESNVVEVTIRNLRAKLSDAGSSLVIQNRRNIGYWIEN